jgi:hypothetical protein
MAEKAKRELPSQLKQLLALDVKLSKDVMEAVNRFQPFSLNPNHCVSWYRMTYHFVTVRSLSQKNILMG